MRDELFDRDYAALRSAGNRDLAVRLDRLAATVKTAFAALHRAQFRAPWRGRKTRIGWS